MGSKSPAHMHRKSNSYINDTSEEGRLMCVFSMKEQVGALVDALRIFKVRCTLSAFKMKNMLRNSYKVANNNVHVEK